MPFPDHVQAELDALRRPREIPVAPPAQPEFAPHGLTAAQACQLDKGGEAFELHGYGDDDRSEVTPELIAAREAAERDTSARMAALLEPLTDTQRAALLEGTKALAIVFPKA